MRYTHLLALVAIIVVYAAALSEPIYTIHYVRSYRNDLVQNNFGCSKGVVYGVYLYPMGPVDAMYALMNPHIYGFASNCQRKETYLKLFGDAQDYSRLLDINESIMNQIAQSLNRASTKAVIIDWKYLPEGSLREKARKSLEDITNSLKNKGFKVIIKAPASYFCLLVGDRKFILDQPTNQFIIELYGQEPGQYTTYESIFGEEGTTFDGYSSGCPKYPTRPILNTVAGDKKIYFQKTLDPSQPGFIGPNWQKYLEKAGQPQTKNIYFYDGFPQQTVGF